MKVLAGFGPGLLTAATALAYGHWLMTATAAGAPAGGTSEPATLLLSGGVLLGLAGAIRRLTF